MQNSIYKGIILAGGHGSRLFPITKYLCKQLMPVYDKPLIYYPITSMILSGVQEILIISTPDSVPTLENAIGNGSNFGVHIEYVVQHEPKGIAEAFILAEDFLAGSPSILILGDNIFYCSQFGGLIKTAMKQNNGATVFGFPVKDPERFGIIEMEEGTDRVLSIEEKPQQPKSNLAAVGLYLHSGDAVQKVKSLKPSARGELEVTDLNVLYLQEKRLNYLRFSRGDFWFDVGVFDALNDASNLVRLVEQYTGLKIGCPEEASLAMHNLTVEQLQQIIASMEQNTYSDYLRQLIQAH